MHQQTDKQKINKQTKSKIRKAIPGNQDQPEQVSVDWPGDFDGIKESWLGPAQTLVSSEYAPQGPSLLQVRVNHSLIPRRNQRRPHQRRQTNLEAKAVQHKQGCEHSLKPGANASKHAINKSPLNTHTNIYLPNDSVVAVVVAAQL